MDGIVFLTNVQPPKTTAFQRSPFVAFLSSWTVQVNDWTGGPGGKTGGLGKMLGLEVLEGGSCPWVLRETCWWLNFFLPKMSGVNGSPFVWGIKGSKNGKKR